MFTLYRIHMVLCSLFTTVASLPFIVTDQVCMTVGLEQVDGLFCAPLKCVFPLPHLTLSLHLGEDFT